MLQTRSSIQLEHILFHWGGGVQGVGCRGWGCMAICQALATISVADPECLSHIPDPDFYPSRIPDLGPGYKNSNKRGGGKKYCPTFFAATNITKIKTILFLTR